MRKRAVNGGVLERSTLTIVVIVKGHQPRLKGAEQTIFISYEERSDSSRCHCVCCLLWGFFSNGLVPSGS